MSLHVICGPMRAGKTAELIRLVRQARAEWPETLAAQVVVLEAIRDSKTAPVAAGPLP